MELIYNIAENKEAVEKSLMKHGYAAEHNLFHYLSQEGPHKENVFFHHEAHKGIMARKHRNGLWHTFSDVLAPEKERMKIFESFLAHIFGTENANKIVVEAHSSFFSDIKKNLPSLYKLCRINYTLHWPVFEMKKWDTALSGKEFKKLRNIKNNFFKLHKVEVVDSASVDREKLKQIVRDWRKSRGGADYAYYHAFLNLIESGFEGIDNARTLVVDGIPSTITAGWKIPNTNNYYSAIGLLNYKFPGLGEAANILDLNELKQQGYDLVDFGGSDEDLLRFKNKFRPSSVYQTHIFSIKKA